MKLLLIVLFLFAANAKAQGWNVEASAYGCGDSEGPAYADAEQKALSQLSGAQTRCSQQGGQFNTSTQRLFCSPDDPGDLFCRISCPVLVRANCELETIFIESDVRVVEETGNGNGAMDPSEEVKVSIAFKNPGRTAMTDVKVDLSLDQGDSLLELRSSTAVVGRLEAGQSKTVSFVGKVPTNATCGSSDMLRFVVHTSSYSRHFSKPFHVGNLSQPIVVEEQNISWKLSQQGITSFPIDVVAPDTEALEVRLIYRARVQNPNGFRLWMHSPDRKDSWAYYADERRTDFTFNDDLTEQFKDAKVKGLWHLSGDMSAGNSVEITSYKLIVTPKVFSCN